MTISQEHDDQLLVELCACEVSVWDALTRGDRQADDGALADIFLGVYSDGFAGKCDHVQQLGSGATMQSYRLSMHRVMALGAEHAVLSYRVDFLRAGKADPEAMYVSSIWQRRAGGWINIFSQDTIATD
ncbi:MAG: nuclear transport factor 2 family protein [Loktanella sp.]|nr:nuclear transport factor 2 family protein [Loktanella sp.]